MPLAELAVYGPYSLPDAGLSGDAACRLLHGGDLASVVNARLERMGLSPLARAMLPSETNISRERSLRDHTPAASATEWLTHRAGLVYGCIMHAGGIAGVAPGDVTGEQMAALKSRWPQVAQTVVDVSPGDLWWDTAVVAVRVELAKLIKDCREPLKAGADAPQSGDGIEQTSPVARAIAWMLDRHKVTGKIPRLNDILIAVPDTIRATLYRDPQFGAARKALKDQHRASIPRGTKSRDGFVDAEVDNDRDVW